MYTFVIQYCVNCSIELYFLMNWLIEKIFWVSDGHLEHKTYTKNRDFIDNNP